MPAIFQNCAAAMWFLMLVTVTADNDERFLSRCPSLEYIRCADGILCIHKRWMCDGRVDCTDYSDEDASLCLKRPKYGQLDGSGRYVPRTRKCPRTWFACADGSMCLAPRFVCDQRHDCRDGSDEDGFCQSWHALKKNTTAGENNLD